MKPLLMPPMFDGERLQIGDQVRAKDSPDVVATVTAWEWYGRGMNRAGQLNYVWSFTLRCNCSGAECSGYSPENWERVP